MWMNASWCKDSVWRINMYSPFHSCTLPTKYKRLKWHCTQLQPLQFLPFRLKHLFKSDCCMYFVFLLIFHVSLFKSLIVLLRGRNRPLRMAVGEKKIFNFAGVFVNQSQTLYLEYYTWGCVCNKVVLLCSETLLCAGFKGYIKYM